MWSASEAAELELAALFALASAAAAPDAECVPEAAAREVLARRAPDRGGWAAVGAPSSATGERVADGRRRGDPLWETCRVSGPARGVALADGTAEAKIAAERHRTASAWPRRLSLCRMIFRALIASASIVCQPGERGGAVAGVVRLAHDDHRKTMWRTGDGTVPIVRRAGCGEVTAARAECGGAGALGAAAAPTRCGGLERLRQSRRRASAR